MAFKRALWHSGLNYQQQCRTCRSVVRYTDYSLDFRPWYADGFVYCPKCKTPLRHNEGYAINEDGTPYYQQPPQPMPQQPVPPQQPAAPNMPASGAVAYCTNCGKPYTPGDAHFCSVCGKKLD